MSKSSENVKAWRRSMKTRVVSAMGGACQICGYDRCASALDLHHIDPNEKEVMISSLLSCPRSWRRIVEELAKCILLCANCHRELHAGFIQLPVAFKVYDQEFEQAFQERKTRLLKYQTDACPQCGSPKLETQTTCSRKCYHERRECIVWPNDEELHRLVWSVSLAKLSVQLGISDVAIAKRCKNRLIPTPPVGYWNRKTSCSVA